MNAECMIRCAAKQARYSRNKKDCKYPSIDPGSRVVLDEVGMVKCGKEPAEDQTAKEMAVNIHCRRVYQILDI